MFWSTERLPSSTDILLTTLEGLARKQEAWNTWGNWENARATGARGEWLGYCIRRNIGDGGKSGNLFVLDKSGQLFLITSDKDGVEVQTALPLTRAQRKRVLKIINDISVAKTLWVADKELLGDK